MRLYFRYFGIHLRSAMQYKTSFLLTVFGQTMTTLTAFLGIYFLMNRFNTVDGFTRNEVLLCFSVVLMAFSLAECFARGFDEFSRMIGNGEFERILTRPRSLILQVLGSKIEFTRVGRFIYALIVLVYTIINCGIHWSADKIFTLILMIVCGTLVFSALFVVFASLCFFTTDGLEFMNILTDGGREFGAYPFSVYGKHILRFYTFIVPVALCQ